MHVLFVFEINSVYLLVGVGWELSDGKGKEDRYPLKDLKTYNK